MEDIAISKNHSLEELLINKHIQKMLCDDPFCIMNNTNIRISSLEAIVATASKIIESYEKLNIMSIGSGKLGMETLFTSEILKQNPNFDQKKLQLFFADPLYFMDYQNNKKYDPLPFLSFLKKNCNLEDENSPKILFDCFEVIQIFKKKEINNESTLVVIYDVLKDEKDANDMLKVFPEETSCLISFYYDTEKKNPGHLVRYNKKIETNIL